MATARAAAGTGNEMHCGGCVFLAVALEDLSLGLYVVVLTTPVLSSVYGRIARLDFQ
jgi:hypothetical protein